MTNSGIVQDQSLERSPNSSSVLVPQIQPNRNEQAVTGQFSYVSSTPAIVPKGSKRSIWPLILQVFFIVILSTGITAIYYGFYASDRYVSSTQIVIQSNDGQSSFGLQSLLGGGGALMGGGAGGGQGDILATYIHSTTMLEQLQGLLSLRELYSPEEADILSKLGSDASQEDFLEYYISRTSVTWDSATSLLALESQAFNPNDAKLILDTIIMLSEEKLNSMTERKQRDLVAFAKEELQRAEKRMTEARIAVTDFRQLYGEIDPVSTAVATTGLLASIQQQLTADRANLESMLYVMKEESPQIRTLQARIKSLENQRDEERGRLTGKSKNVLSDLVSKYEGLQIEVEFSRAIYASALSFLESTRARAQQEASYVVDFVPANLPDEATEPKKVIIVVTVFIVSLLALGISNLIIAAIREQAKI